MMCDLRHALLLLVLQTCDPTIFKTVFAEGWFELFVGFPTLSAYRSVCEWEPETFQMVTANKDRQHPSTQHISPKIQCEIYIHVTAVQEPLTCEVGQAGPLILEYDPDGTADQTIRIRIQGQWAQSTVIILRILRRDSSFPNSSDYILLASVIWTDMNLTSTLDWSVHIGTLRFPTSRSMTGVSRSSSITWQIPIRYRLVCGQHFFGPFCKLFCRPQQGRYGHYECEKSTGRKICQSGWGGTRCDQAICEPLCEHGQCVKPNFCKCPPGWRGRICEQCRAYPGCAHGQCAIDNMTKMPIPFTCDCLPGWGGMLCSFDMQHCRNHPDLCKNHGKCIDVWNSRSLEYRCICQPGYAGQHCEQRIEREHRPHLNGWSCSVDESKKVTKCGSSVHCQRLCVERSQAEQKQDADSGDIHAKNSSMHEEASPPVSQQPSRSYCFTVDMGTHPDNLMHHQLEVCCCSSSAPSEFMPSILGILNMNHDQSVGIIRSASGIKEHVRTEDNLQTGASFGTNFTVVWKRFHPSPFSIFLAIATFILFVIVLKFLSHKHPIFCLRHRHLEQRPTNGVLCTQQSSSHSLLTGQIALSDKTEDEELQRKQSYGFSVKQDTFLT
ncbi:unnamed protein product [Calicophoron daubneyi]|uniref:Delta-like protein n=1 Tax=Calicophoron daubneyi TaxID=300641 RepID=A0AAV2T5E2_CALDB